MNHPALTVVMEKAKDVHSNASAQIKEYLQLALRIKSPSNDRAKSPDQADEDPIEQLILVPSDAEIIQEAMKVRKKWPDLKTKRLFCYVAAANKWPSSVPANRLFSIALQRNLFRKPLVLPDDGFAALVEYKVKSTRTFRLYSRGKYDYGVSLATHFDTVADEMHDYLADEGWPYNPKLEQHMALSWAMQGLLELYWAAGQKLGLEKEEIGKQLENEYGVNPFRYMLYPSHFDEDFATRNLAQKRIRDGMCMWAKLMAIPSFKDYVRARNEEGELLEWNYTAMEAFIMTIVKIDKKHGLREFGKIEEIPKDHDI